MPNLSGTIHVSIKSLDILQISNCGIQIFWVSPNWVKFAAFRISLNTNSSAGPLIFHNRLFNKQTTSREPDLPATADQLLSRSRKKIQSLVNTDIVSSFRDHFWLVFILLPVNLGIDDSLRLISKCIMDRFQPEVVKHKCVSKREIFATVRAVK